MKIIKTFKFKLEPTKEQIEKIEWTTLDMCRWLYNSALEQRRIAWEKYNVSLNYNKQAKELPKLSFGCVHISIIIKIKIFFSVHKRGGDTSYVQV